MHGDRAGLFSMRLGHQGAQPISWAHDADAYFSNVAERPCPPVKVSARFA